MQRHARPQSRKGKQVFVIAIVGVVITGWRQRDRRPELSLIGPVERRPHHADYAIRLVVQHQRLAYDVGIGPEVLLPCAIRQHHLIRGAGLVFFWREHAPHHRLHPERVEVGGGDFSAVEQLRIGIFAAVVEAGALHYSSRREDVLAIGCIAKVRWREADVAEVRHSFVAGAQRDQAIGIRNAAGIQQHRIGHGEDRNVGANAQRQRQN